MRERGGKGNATEGMVEGGAAVEEEDRDGNGLVSAGEASQTWENKGAVNMNNVRVACRAKHE